MSSRYFWFSQHKTALMTVAKYLSLEVGELLPVLDKKIKQKRRAAMTMAAMTTYSDIPGRAAGTSVNGSPFVSNPSSNKKRKLSMTIDNSDSYIVSNDNWTGEEVSSHNFIHSPFQKKVSTSG